MRRALLAAPLLLGPSALGTLGAVALADVGAPPALPTLPTGEEPPSDGALRVRLVFGAGADLDLFVTDPLQETVYFGNTPSRSGGALRADRRCDAPTPRVETVVFPRPLPGRYRVSVDHPEACDGSRAAAEFLVVVDLPAPAAADARGRPPPAPGPSRREQRGRLEPGRFEVEVLEFELPAP